VPSASAGSNSQRKPRAGGSSISADQSASSASRSGPSRDERAKSRDAAKAKLQVSSRKVQRATALDANAMAAASEEEDCDEEPADEEEQEEEEQQPAARGNSRKRAIPAAAAGQRKGKRQRGERGVAVLAAAAGTAAAAAHQPVTMESMQAMLANNRTETVAQIEASLSAQVAAKVAEGTNATKAELHAIKSHLNGTTNNFQWMQEQLQQHSSSIQSIMSYLTQAALPAGRQQQQQQQQQQPSLMPPQGVDAVPATLPPFTNAPQQQPMQQQPQRSSISAHIMSSDGSVMQQLHPQPPQPPQWTQQAYAPQYPNQQWQPQQGRGSAPVRLSMFNMDPHA